VIRKILPEGGLKHTEEINEAGKRIRSVLNRKSEKLPFKHPEEIEELTELVDTIGKQTLFGRSYVSRVDQEVFVHKIGRLQEWDIHEPGVLHQLKQEGVLKSTLPDPLAYYRVYKLKEVIYKPIQDQGIKVSKNNVPVYKYKATENYIRYLNGADVTDEEFEKGLRAFVHDTIYILRNYGLILNLADLFHNNEQGRRLIVMRDLFVKEKEKSSNFITTGLGRIDNVPKAVRFPNGRVAGLADFADATPLENIQRWPRGWAADLDGIKCTWEPVANGIAEPILTVLLMALTRLDDQGRLDWEDPKIQELMVEWAQASFCEALCTYTKRPEAECKEFMLNFDFDWLGYVNESMYWYQNNVRGYLGGLKRGTIPQQILPKTDEVKFRRATAAPNFKFNVGSSNDGKNKDIGLFNATAGLTRFELLMYQLNIAALTVAEADFLEMNAKHTLSKL
jgi:hypothetical protein